MSAAVTPAMSTAVNPNHSPAAAPKKAALCVVSSRRPAAKSSATQATVTAQPSSHSSAETPRASPPPGASANSSSPTAAAIPTAAIQSRARRRVRKASPDRTSVTASSDTMIGWMRTIGPVASAAACNTSPQSMTTTPAPHTGVLTSPLSAPTSRSLPCGCFRAPARCSTAPAAFAKAAATARSTVSISSR
ncbi:hypothetical protein L1857_22865 [Amycolatopsis thermalba]|uniref:Uncharacterized protein n=1 Tax=Amycolatopsis thermalba TaxID=944492 RepID=A0ABY4NZG9_9PSEU|nr:hypothetical protein L1857_22865 [Amycolatopsis thermalba]